MILDKQGPIFVKKKIWKALAMILEFVTSLPFTLVILGCLLLLCFNVISCQAPFQVNDLSF